MTMMRKFEVMSDKFNANRNGKKSNNFIINIK